MHRNSQGEHLFKVSNENKHSGQIILQKLRTCSSSNRQGKNCYSIFLIFVIVGAIFGYRMFFLGLG